MIIEVKKCITTLYQMLVMLLFFSAPLSASMQDNLEKAFSALGMSNNVTSAGGYQDQTGGFYTEVVALDGLQAL